jgi:hypothetical protein
VTKNRGVSGRGGGGGSVHITSPGLLLRGWGNYMMSVVLLCVCVRALVRWCVCVCARVDHTLFALLLLR